MAIGLGWAPTDAHDEDRHGVGTEKCSPDGKTYRYVEFVDIDTLAGGICYPANTDVTQVTMDVAGGSAIAAVAAGIVPVVIDISAAQYGWIQVGGVAAKVIGDGAVAAGEAVIPDATANGTADTMAAGEEHLSFGTALEADATDGTSIVFACLLKIR